MKARGSDFWHDPTDERHGTANGYKNLRCRCSRCIEANRLLMIKIRERLRSDPTPDHVHGTASGYTNYYCRCSLCTKSHTEYRREWARAKGEA